MAAVSAGEEPMTKKPRHDRAQRALQMAVVSGFMGDSRGVQESCLDLCNACREGVPLECLSIGKDVPPTLLAMVLPSSNQAQQPETPPTRVLQPRRVLKVEWHFNDVFADRVSEVQWPEGTKEIYLFRLNRTVNGVAWPVSLDRLSFCTLGPTRFAMQGTWSPFNHPLQGVIFPSGLREIFLGDSFDQPIEDVVWPQGLEKMSLPRCDQPIDGVRWPPALKSLEFMPPENITLRKDPKTCLESISFNKDGFNHPFTTLPASLETLWLSDGFAQSSLEGIAWPPGLVTLGLGYRFKSVFTNRISWPSSLRHIYSVHEIGGGAQSPPQGCVVTVVKEYDSEYERYVEEEELRENPWMHGELYEGSGADVDEGDDCDY